MALKNCPACGTSVSKSAAACPACGHPLKAKQYGCGTLIAAGFAVLAIITMVRSCSGGSAVSTPAIVPPSAEQVEAAREAAAIARAERARRWVYDQSTDDMTSGKVLLASLFSVNSFELGSPYQGVQRGTLQLRQHPRYGTDVIVSIEEGQIVCSIRDCAKQVRFDDAAPRNWGVSKPENYASEILFMNDSRRFIQQLRGAKTVRIQLNIYRNPPVTLEFDVSEFDYDRWQGKAPAGVPAQAARPETQGRS